jgi:hypothetical protein
MLLFWRWETQKVTLYRDLDERLEIIMAMQIQDVVFWIVTTCSDEIGYHSFQGPYRLPEDGDSRGSFNFNFCHLKHLKLHEKWFL